MVGAFPNAKTCGSQATPNVQKPRGGHITAPFRLSPQISLHQRAETSNAKHYHHININTYFQIAVSDIYRALLANKRDVYCGDMAVQTVEGEQSEEGSC